MTEMEVGQVDMRMREIILEENGHSNTIVIGVRAERNVHPRLKTPRLCKVKAGAKRKRKWNGGR